MSGINFWGLLLERLREEQGMSQRTLASATRVNRSTLRKLEKGEITGDIRTLEKLLLALGYELEAIPTRIDRSLSREAALFTLDQGRRSRVAAARMLTMPLD